MTQTDQSPAVARLEQIEDGGFFETEARIDGDDESLILHRNGDQVRAWLNVCPHAGRRLDWAPGKFLRDKAGHLMCAVHGATFELAEGVCIAGPCKGAALRAIDVDVRDGDVVLRTSG